MFTIFLTTSFRASHQLTFSDGATEPRHEHDWKVCTAVSAETLNSDGLVMDFEELKHLLEDVLQDFAGQCLEKTPFFDKQNASAENVAFTLYRQIEPKLPRSLHLDYVEITEAAGCRARFSA